MITIIPKPTDIPADNSTVMVMNELKKAGASYKVRYLETIDPFSSDVLGETIWVCGIRQNGQNLETLEALELSNRIINSPKAIVTCANKVMTTTLLYRDKVPTPETFFTESLELAAGFINRHKKVVYKPVYGFDGNGIRLITDVSDLKTEQPPYYLQEYIPNDRDFRVFVIDGKAVGAIKRVSDSLTHNIHQGGAGIAVEIDTEMADIAGRAAKSAGVDYGGVDLLRGKDGYTVLEVNGTPNWHCMQAPIPKFLASYLIEQAKCERG